MVMYPWFLGASNVMCLKPLSQNIPCQICCLVEVGYLVKDGRHAHLAFTWKSTIDTLEKAVKYVQS